MRNQHVVTWRNDEPGHVFVIIWDRGKMEMVEEVFELTLPTSTAEDASALDRICSALADLWDMDSLPGVFTQF